MFLAHFLYRNLKGYRFLVVLAVLMTFANVGSALLSTLPLKFIFDKLTLPNHPDPQFPFSANLLDFFRGFAPGNKGVVILSVTMILALALLGAVLSFIQTYLAAFIAKKTTVRLSQQIFNQLQRLPVAWHNAPERQAGDLALRVTSNMADLEKFITDGMIDLLTGTLTLFGVLAVMISISPPLTIISMLIMMLLGFLVPFYTRSIKKATRKEKKAEGEVAAVATDTMGKIKEIKAFLIETVMFKQFQERAERKLEAGKRAAVLQAQFTPLVDVVGATGAAMILLIGVMAYIDGSLSLGPFTITAQQASLGILTVFIVYLGKLYQPIRDLSKLTLLTASASESALRMQEVLEQEQEDLTIPASYSGPRRFQGSISYSDVIFNYAPDMPPVLKGVTIDNIPAGRKVALVGLSGSGKTTLASLLPRFYEVKPGWGTVKIDGRDIRKYPLAVLRQNISVVFQESILFEGTFEENIKIGNPEATEAQVIEAAKQACIHETIMKKPDGYKTKITGKDLSGGQRQRIAIARAILRNAPIIIMDEPTAALDAEAEAEVLRALDGLAAGKTVLMITHRLSTINKVDEIIVLHEGRVAERGTFKQLMAQNGIFKRFWDIQNPPDIEQDESRSFIRTVVAPPDPRISKGHIEVRVNDQLIKVYPLNKYLMTIGTFASNDIQIVAPFVSRCHAKLIWDTDAWVLKDAESTNGIVFNGQRVDQVRLRDGNRIYLGHPSVELLYRGVSAPDSISLQPIKAQILLEMEGHIINTCDLTKPTLTVGREPGKNGALDIRIPNMPTTKDISRLHATIIWDWQQGAWVIKKDQEAKNGLLYNGQQVEQHPLRDGDRVYLAPSQVVALLYKTL
jgi:ATP-binding cassette subfamily B protein